MHAVLPPGSPTTLYCSACTSCTRRCSGGDLFQAYGAGDHMLSHFFSVSSMQPCQCCCTSLSTLGRQDGCHPNRPYLFLVVAIYTFSCYMNFPHTPQGGCLHGTRRHPGQHLRRHDAACAQVSVQAYLIVRTGVDVHTVRIARTFKLPFILCVCTINPVCWLACMRPALAVCASPAHTVSCIIPSILYPHGNTH